MTEERYELINDTLGTLGVDDWAEIMYTYYLSDENLDLSVGGIADPILAAINIFNEKTCVWC